MTVSGQLVTAIAAAAFPTVAVLIGVLVNDRSLRKIGRSFDVVSLDMDQGFDSVGRHIDDLFHAVRSDLRRMEQRLDARLTRLEARLLG